MTTTTKQTTFSIRMYPDFRKRDCWVCDNGERDPCILHGPEGYPYVFAGDNPICPDCARKHAPGLAALLPGPSTPMCKHIEDPKREDIAEIKGKRLARYCTREPVLFIQRDGRVLKDGEDAIRNPDEDGDCLMGTTTYELMSGDPSVRVLISRKTRATDAVRLLKKIAGVNPFSS